MTLEWALITAAWAALLAAIAGYVIGRSHGFDAGKLHLFQWAQHAAVCHGLPASKGRACTCGLLQAVES